jgi:hypothetical protein
MHHPFFPLIQKGRQTRATAWQRAMQTGSLPAPGQAPPAPLGRTLALGLVVSAIFTLLVLGLAWSWNPMHLFHTPDGSAVWSEILPLGAIVFLLTFLLWLPVSFLLTLTGPRPHDPNQLTTPDL